MSKDKLVEQDLTDIFSRHKRLINYLYIMPSFVVVCLLFFIFFVYFALLIFCIYFEINLFCYLFIYFNFVFNIQNEETNENEKGEENANEKERGRHEMKGELRRRMGKGKKG